MSSTKKYIVLMLPLLALTAKVDAQNFSDPVVYNNYLITEQSALIQQGLEYISYSVHSEDFDEIENRRQKLLSEIQKSMMKINRLPDFQGTSRLKRETIEVFDLYLQTYETDLIEVLGLKKKYTNSYEALEAYLEAETAMEDKLRSAVEKLSKAQEAFAKKYDLKFSGEGGDSDLNSSVKRISELSEYSRLVFLEYFKVSWKFNDMVSILHERDGKKLDKRRVEVLEAASEAFINLRKIKRFDNESDYMDQTVDLIKYFNSLSRSEFSRVVLIFNKDSMSQKEADYVNKVFADYNANIEVLVYNWNLANQYLWRDHIE